MYEDEVTPAVWFPAVRTGSGADVFTVRLAEALNSRGMRAEITWLPHRAEYLPWAVQVPEQPAWAKIVHVNTWLDRRFIPSGLPIVATVHLCVHDPAMSPYKSSAQALYHRFRIKPVEEYVIRNAQRVIAVSHYTSERTKEAFGFHDVQVIHNGVPMPAAVGCLSKNKPHTPFRLLYAGNWSKRKGVDLLGPIMDELGDGFELWYTADARGAHTKSELPTNCRCIGRLDQQQVQQVYREVDVLIFPTRLEGFGLVAAEAMASGLPVIAAASSSLPEIIDDGVSGILCPPNDVAAFVFAARRLSRDAGSYRATSMAARLRAEKEFGLDGMVGEYASIYDSLLQLSM